MSQFIELYNLKCDGKVLTYEFYSSLDVFNKQKFFIEYPKPIAEPLESMNAIPFAAVMAPISWATGANLVIPHLDAAYAQALEAASLFWKKCFTDAWSFRGQLFTRSVRQKRQRREKTGMLFSGGLDSLTSYVKNREKKPELFTVIGADFPYAKTDFASMCKEKLFEQLARQENIDLTYIHTNIGEILNLKSLERYAKNWYGAVQHALMLTALVAPLTHHYLKTLLIASCSHKPNLDFPCGGEPEVVRKLRWGNTAVQDDLYEMNRAQKVAAHLKGRNEFYPYLRVCWAQFKEMNCSRCEKCLRTICELLLNNMDPNQLNFNVTPETLPALKTKLTRKFNLIFRGNEMQINYWRAIQETVRLNELQDLYGSKSFFQWFKDFVRLKKRGSRIVLFLLMPYFALRDALSHLKEYLLSRHLQSYS